MDVILINIECFNENILGGPTSIKEDAHITIVIKHKERTSHFHTYAPLIPTKHPSLCHAAFFLVIIIQMIQGSYVHDSPYDRVSRYCNNF